MSVSTRPGATAFTVTPRAATSRASDFVKPITPAFAAAYATCPALPISATTEVRFTILPYRARTMARTAALVQWKTPVRLVRRTRSQSSSLRRRRSASTARPALLTSRSRARPGRRASRSCGEHLPRTRDAVHVARRHAHERRRNPPAEPGEDATRAGLEGEGSAECGERPHRLLPAHGRGHLLHEEPGQLRRAAHRARLDAAHDRQPRRVKRHPGQMAREPSGRRLHERAVKRRAHRQELRPRAAGGGE